MAEWKKVPAAARDWAGGISAKTVYAAIRKGQLRAAHIGTGRNVLVCQAYVDEWLHGSAKQPPANLEVLRRA